MRRRRNSSQTARQAINDYIDAIIYIYQSGFSLEKAADIVAQPAANTQYSEAEIKKIIDLLNKDIESHSDPIDFYTDNFYTEGVTDIEVLYALKGSLSYYYNIGDYKDYNDY